MSALDDATARWTRAALDAEEAAVAARENPSPEMTQRVKELVDAAAAWRLKVQALRAAADKPLRRLIVATDKPLRRLIVATSAQAAARLQRAKAAKADVGVLSVLEGDLRAARSREAAVSQSDAVARTVGGSIQDLLLFTSPLWGYALWRRFVR